jgi:TniQ/Sigma-70, region 4
MTGRALPIRLPPVPGEAIDSYLEALASRSRAAWGDMIDAVGLGSATSSSGTGIYPWLIQLTESQSTALSRSTGVDTSTLIAMTLSGLMSAVRRAPSVPVLISPPRSRFCPHCLGDDHGRWQLWWRMRWAFACPRHRCLLLDACPECGRWQRVGPFPTGLVPKVGICARKAHGAFGRNLTRCGATLSVVHTATALPSDDPVVSAQSRVLQYLRHGSVTDGIYSSHPIDVVQFLADVAALATRVLHYAGPVDLESRLPSHLLDLYREHLRSDPGPAGNSRSAESAVSVRAAVGAVCALDVLGAPDAWTAGERLRWLISCSRRRAEAVTASNIGWGKHVSDVLRGVQLSALEPFLGPSDQLRYRCGAGLPRRPRRAPMRHCRVPALLWSSAARRFSVAGIGAEQLASALAAAALVVGTPTTLSQATALLGSVTTAGSVSRVLQALRADESWCAMRVAMVQIADAVDCGECPIDYHARRAVPFDEFLPAHEWHQICSDTATPAGRRIKITLARSWMNQRLVGSPARFAPGVITGRDYRVRLAHFVRAMTPELVDRLDQSACSFLREHIHADEPLHWQPPETLLHNADLPENTPMVDITRLHQLVRDPHLNLTEIANQLDITLTEVLDILESQPAPSVHLNDDQRRARGHIFASAKAELSHSMLIELYVGQGLGLAEIGARFGISRQTVRRLASLYNISVRPAGRPDSHAVNSAAT